MTGHTPGPWGVMPPSETGAWGLCVGEAADKGSQLIVARIPGGGKGVRIANARLIAAAPDLLEACKEFEVVECSGCDGTGREDDREDEACHACGGFGQRITGGNPGALLAAIAKAEARS